MPEARSAAAFHPDHGWVITGGNPGNPKRGAESTRNGRTFQKFTSLPLALSDHCLVSLDGKGDSGDYYVGLESKARQIQCVSVIWSTVLSKEN